MLYEREEMMRGSAILGLWKAILATALVFSLTYLAFKLSPLADPYKNKIKKSN